MALPQTLEDWFAQWSTYERLKLCPRWVREDVLFSIEAGERKP